jgi:TP901 family phage tail tape measure protein
MFGGFGDWIIGVYLRFTTDGPATMARLSAASSAANAQLLRQQGLIDANTAAMLRYERQIEAVRMRQLQLGTRIAGGIALGGLALGIAGLDQAAQLQKAMVSVGIATNTPESRMEPFRALALQVSNYTAQSIATIGREMATAAAAGLKQPSQLIGAFPHIAKAADVLWLSPQHVDPVNAVKLLTQLTHLFGAYQGPAFTHMLNRATQLMFSQPERFQQMVTQGKYFIPMAVQAGVGEDDIFKLLMSMGQTGLGRGRGGSGIRRMIEYLLGAATLTGHLSAAQHAAMGAGFAGHPGLNILGPDGRLRGTFEDKHGNLLLGKVLAFLESERSRFRPADFANDLTNAFLQQGGLVAGTLLLPQVYAQTSRNWAMVQQQADIEGMWRRYSNTLNFAVPQFLTNFKNVLAEMFYPALKPTTAALKSAATELGIFSQYLEHNQGAAMNWVKGIAAFTAWASARWMLGIASMTRSMLGISGSMNAVANSIQIATDRILADSELIAAGGGRRGVPFVPVPGVRIPGAVEDSGFIRFLKGADNLILGGLGQLLIMGAGKFAGLLRGIGARLIIDPLLKIGLGFEGFGRVLLSSGNPIVAGLGRVVAGLGKFSWGLGAVADGIAAALLRLAGPLSALLSLSGDSGSHSNVNYTIQGEQQYLRDLGARIRRYGPRRALEGVHPYDTTPQGSRAVHIHGNINFNLPRGTPTAQGRAAFQHFLNLTGAIGTSAYLPNPITVGGAAFGSR